MIMKQRFLLLVLALGMFSTNVNAQTKKHTFTKKTTTHATSAITKERCVGVDGFIWYKIKKGDLYGVQDIEGNVIIPIKYTQIKYYSDQFRYFEVNLGDFYGIYSRKGTLIIPIERHYTTIMEGQLSDKIKDVIYWTAKRNDGRRIALDARGNEVIQGKQNYQNIRMEYDRGTDGKPYYFIVFQGTYPNYQHGICDLDGRELLPMKYEMCWINKGSIHKKENGKYVDDIINYVGDTKYDYQNFDDLYNYNYQYNSEASTSTSSSSTSSSSISNSNNNSGNETTTVVVEHHRDPVPVQEWVQCTACWGSTICPNCAGSGTTYIGSNLHRCSRCGGRKICTSCSGKGGRYITVYK